MSVVIRIGLISDTHGIVPSGVFRAFAGVARIVHAGDVGSLGVLDELALIAPVTAVRGNSDFDPAVVRAFPLVSMVDIAGVSLAVTHIKGRALTVEEARRAGCDVYVSGHTHVPCVEQDDGLWTVNPGSATHARGGSRESVGIVEVSQGVVRTVELVELY